MAVLSTVCTILISTKGLFNHLHHFERTFEIGSIIHCCIVEAGSVCLDSSCRRIGSIGGLVWGWCVDKCICLDYFCLGGCLV